MSRLRFQLNSRRRHQDDAGTALTEFVVVIPLFVLLLFWAEFFVDIGIVKLKVEEAARYALWETAAQRKVTDIRADLQRRFSDLSSPEAITSSTPIGTRSFPAINISNVNIVTNLEAKFDGRVTLNWGSGNSGLIGQIVQGIASFIGRAVDSLVRGMGFETKREARATVEFQVNNTLFPGGKLFYALLDPEQSRTLTVRAQSPVMLIDTWKAWPGPFALSSNNTNADPYQTYSQGGASLPEREVSARMNRMAFFGNNGVVRALNTLVSFTGFPKPFDTKTWKDNNGPGTGPVVMLPGDAPKHAWVPTSLGNALVSVGGLTKSANTAIVPVPDSPEEGVDRFRSSVPNRMHTGFWMAEGGQRNAGRAVQTPSFTVIQNPYQLMYQCRDAFYLGSTTPGHKRWDNRNANQQAFPSCR